MDLDKAFKIPSYLVIESGRSRWKPDEVKTTLYSPIYPTPPLEQDVTQDQFFKRSLAGLNSEFSFS